MNTIGPYQILGELGASEMGAVYRAFQTSAKRLVALKVMPPALEKNISAVELFRLEAKTATGLAHENIVKAWDASVQSPPYYIAFEYMAGGSLARRLSDGSLPLGEAARIFVKLCAALEYAHAQGVIHRQVEPAKILLDRKSRPVLSGFGAAGSGDRSSLSVAEGEYGKQHYMSPEAIQGHQLDHRSDLYSLAAVFYAMLTGRPPFAGDDPEAPRERILNDRPTALRSFKPDLPAELDLFFAKALAKKPGERFQNGREMAEALELALAKTPAARFAEAQPRADKPKPGRSAAGNEEGLPMATVRKRPVLVGALLALILAAGGVLVYGLRRHSPTIPIALTNGAPPRVEPGAGAGARAEAAPQPIPDPKPSAVPVEPSPPPSSPAPARTDSAAPRVNPVYQLSGYVRDKNGAGIKGVTVSFNGARPVTTDGDGFWAQKNLSGPVVIRAAKPGWSFTPDSRKADEAAQILFTGNAMAPAPVETPKQTTVAARTDFRIGGRIVDRSGRALSGIRLSIGEGQEAVTDARGNWTKDGLTGRVTVTPRHGGMIFDPPSIEIEHGSEAINFRASWAELSEDNAGSWLYTRKGGGTLTLADDRAQVSMGQTSLRLEIRAKGDISVQFPRAQNAGWDLSNVREIEICFRAENKGLLASGFESGPVIRMGTSEGFIELSPVRNLLDGALDKWIKLAVPVGGNSEWSRTTSGTVSMARIDWVQIGFNLRRRGVMLWIDGVVFK